MAKQVKKTKKGMILKVETKPVPSAKNEFTPNGMKWVERAQLQNGDVIRVRIQNANHDRYGDYMYAICTGGGFGCNPNALGNAVYVHSEGYDFDEVQTHAKDVRQNEGNHIFGDSRLAPTRVRGQYRFCDGGRWERFWGIDVLRQV